MNVMDLINPYAWIMKLRRSFYRSGILHSASAGLPVISIGNLSAGGTGKTPVTLYLAHLLQQEFHASVAIVLRGYKRTTNGLLVVKNDNTIAASVEQSGDEAQLYAAELDDSIVICDEDRLRGARKAKELGATVVLLDDGFQHQRIRRDLNLVVINASQGIPPIIPFGKGREGTSALRDASAIIVMNAEANKEVLSECSATGLPVLTGKQTIDRLTSIDTPATHHSPLLLQGKRILALSGIGTPQIFEDTLGLLGASVHPYRLADHAEYTPALLEKILAEAQAYEALVTTTKDAVKITPLLSGHTDSPFYVAHSKVILEGPIKELVQNALSGR